MTEYECQAPDLNLCCRQHLLCWLAGCNQHAEQEISEVVEQLVATETLEASRYDLSDRADTLNVILISMDALRYDVTGLDGGVSAAPNLLQLAEESVVFHNATSAAPWTLPSHMSVWTGRWPSIHR